MPEPVVLLFDGVCNLCNSSVQFVLRRDPSKRFRFAALQSEAGRTLLRRCGRRPDDLSGVVLVEGDRCYHRSTAALRAARRLRQPWPLLYVFILIPRFMRNWVYDWIAANRYHWFGKRDQCMVPDDDVKDRFLDVPEAPASADDDARVRPSASAAAQRTG